MIFENNDDFSNEKHLLHNPTKIKKKVKFKIKNNFMDTNNTDYFMKEGLDLELDLNRIKSIITDNYSSDFMKQQEILCYISEHPKAFEYMLTILSYERQRNKELVTESNVLLSNSAVILTNRMSKNYKDALLQRVRDHYKSGKVMSGFAIGSRVFNFKKLDGIKQKRDRYHYNKKL